MQNKTHGAFTPFAKVPSLILTKGPIMTRGSLLKLGLTCLMASGLASEATAGSYKITDLGLVPGIGDSYAGAFAQAINNRGHVVVYAHNSPFIWFMFGDSSFLWTGPNEVELLPGLPGSTDVIATGLNNRDQIVGISGLDGEVEDHAVLWEQGVVHDLGVLPGDTTTWATAINNQGKIVGVSSTAGFTLLRAVTWQNLQIQELPSLAGANFTQANSINDNGQIVGVSGLDYWADYHAVLWDHAGIIDLNTLGGIASYAGAINNQGDTVGVAQTASGDWHATLWQKGIITDLGTLGSDTFSSANSLNDRGQVVGNGVASALLWENGQMTDLQTLIPADSGWMLQYAGSINDRGQIVGYGIYQGSNHAFLLTPAP